MTQLGLLRPKAPELPTTIDLRCVDVGRVLESLEPGTVDLVVADPPWDLYNHPGYDAPGDRYGLLTAAAIGEHLRRGVELLRPGGRLALWTCWPLLVEAIGGGSLPPWLEIPKLRWATGGAWTKLGRPTCGYHWRSGSEPVLIGVRRDGAAGRAFEIVQSGAATVPEQHSRKPAGWMADWCRAWVPRGGLVLDLYAGLGSVAEAVVRAGEARRYIGAEIDPDRHATALAMVRRAVVDGEA